MRSHGMLPKSSAKATPSPGKHSPRNVKRTSGAKLAKARKPSIRGSKLPPAQKPVKTPMKMADRKSRATAAKKMHKAGKSGPVRYKSPMKTSARVLRQYQ